LLQKVNLQKGQELPVQQQNERFENQLTTATQRIEGLHAVKGGRTRRATKFYIDESGKDNSPAEKTSKNKFKAVHKEDMKKMKMKKMKMKQMKKRINDFGKIVSKMFNQ
jgi:hypothetical protein